MISINFPGIIVMILSSLGFIFISLILYKILILIEWKIFKKQTPRSPLEYKMFLLEQENKKLQEKINDLEEENSKFINLLVKHL